MDVLVKKVGQVMEDAWTQHGFCVPNAETYPFQWLWDSCFHALIWAELGDKRGVEELTSVFAYQDPKSGFIPHMTYWADPSFGEPFWGRPKTSSITQPPMYGHAAAELTRRGFVVPDETLERAEHGFRYLLEGRGRTAAGLVPVVHPWETGCDDSPRWDNWSCPDGVRFDSQRWRQTKASLVEAVTFGPSGEPTGSSEFRVGSVGFNALLAWNIEEFVTVPGVQSAAWLLEQSKQLTEAVVSRWNQKSETWVDDRSPSGAIRTVDALLCLLVDPRPEVCKQLIDPAAFGASYGPSGVHQQESSFSPEQYWRGPSWPQLNYLLALAVTRSSSRWPELSDVAEKLVRGLKSGAAISGLAEYWHPHTGAGLGASQQTWAGVAIDV